MVLDVSAGQNADNSQIVAVGAGSKIDAFNHAGASGLKITVNGYFTTGYVPIAPARVLDTRTGSPLTASGGHTSVSSGTVGVSVSGTLEVSTHALFIYSNCQTTPHKNVVSDQPFQVGWFTSAS
ncbi:hypothetical protein ACIQOU_35325 [Streptomyces sp. NPDC091279]|uniref:hypothetical protein n=1 Tax=unclassified Streptomyces TaxID=2593676 RepID=UPI00380DE6FB